MTCLLRGSIPLRRLAVRLATIDAARTLAALRRRQAARARSRGQEAHHRLMLDALATLAAFAVVLAVVAGLV
jgi:hypothetical protein